MGISFKTIDSIAKYAETCGVKSILQTKPIELSKINFFDLKILQKDTILFTNTKTPFVLVPHEHFDTRAKRIANKFYKDCEWHFSSAMAHVKSVLPNFPGEIVGRAKDEMSILSKIFHFFKSNRDLIELESRGIKGRPQDLLGTRGILNTGNSKEVDVVVSDILKMIDEKKLKLNHFSNHGKIPYLTEMQCLEFEKRGAINKTPKQLRGYASAHFYFKDPKENIIEFQLRGPKVNRLAEKEHLMYKLATRDLPLDSVNRNLKISRAWWSLSDAKYVEYKKYVEDYFVHNRNKELGIYSKPPKFPAKVPHILSMKD